jgi:hypothetical protein
MNPWDMLPQAMKDRIAADEAREAREWEARQAERADRADTMARMAQVAENATVYRFGHTSAELREAASNAATAREMRNHQGEWGSAQRTAVTITGADGRVVQLQPREQVPAAQRSGCSDDLGRVTRARQDEFMQRMVREYDERQAARSASVISRSEDPGDQPACRECREVGATARESAQLHAQEDAERGQRAGRTPMIYR